MGSAAAPRVWPGAVEQRSPRAPRPQPQAARGCPVGQTEVVAAPDARTLVSCRSALEAHGVAHAAGLRAPLSLGRSEGREGAEPWTARPRGGSRRARPTRLRSPGPLAELAECPVRGAGWRPAVGPRPTRLRSTRRGPPPTSTSRASGRRVGTRCSPAVQPSGGRPARSPALEGYAAFRAQGGHAGRTPTPSNESQWGPDHAKVDCVHTSRPPPMPIERRTSSLRPAAMGPM